MYGSFGYIWMIILVLIILKCIILVSRNEPDGVRKTMAISLYSDPSLYDGHLSKVTVVLRNRRTVKH